MKDRWVGQNVDPKCPVTGPSVPTPETLRTWVRLLSATQLNSTTI